MSRHDNAPDKESIDSDDRPAATGVGPDEFTIGPNGSVTTRKTGSPDGNVECEDFDVNAEVNGQLQDIKQGGS